jgi:hypothetical protein
MNNPQLSRAVKFGIFLFSVVLAAFWNLTTNRRQRWTIYLALGLFVFMLCGAGFEVIPDLIPNDAKDIWVVGI